jgi:hypothetical protein
VVIVQVIAPTGRAHRQLVLAIASVLRADPDQCASKTMNNKTGMHRTMKIDIRPALALCLTAALSLGASSNAIAQGNQNFTLDNDTGYTVEEVYVSATTSDDWEEDVLGQHVLPDQSSVEITFPGKDKTCVYDLRVVYDDGEVAEWVNFDLCTISRIKISYERKTGKTWAEWE